MNNVCIIILNWNNWQDTIMCLESVFRLNYQAFRVVVCDNNSTDNSLSYIELWASGLLDVLSDSALSLKKYISPPVNKPIKFKKYNREQAESDGNPADNEQRLIMIQIEANLGYAGGNNVGLRYAKSKEHYDYIWILNNDTIVHPDSLTHMVQRLKEDNHAGICGSTLLYFNKPDIVQAYGGGTYSKWFGFSRHIGAFNNIRKPVNTKLVESKIDYIVGASMLVSKDFIKDIGLISEQYFLYFEDLDWSMRAGKKYRLTYSPDSIVYHKEGKTSGGGNRNQKSLIADYYSIRGRLLLTRTYFPFAFLTVYIGLLFTIFNRIIRKQYSRIGMIIRLILNPGADIDTDNL